MTKTEAAERIKNLRKIITDYRYMYHVHDTSTMSEAAADSLKHELAQLEAQYPELITPDSPTQRVAGAALEKFRKVQHMQRMVSLNDVFNREEVEAWAERVHRLLGTASVEYFCDAKMDGLACALTYQDGRLVQALTRGDGFVGEDVTMNVRTIESVPLILRDWQECPEFCRGRTEIRGEIIIFKKDFEDLNASQTAAGKPIYANPRNLAAGTIRQLDPQLVKVRPLRFRGYDILRDDPAEVPTNQFAYQAIRALGVPTNDDRTFDNLADVMRHIARWEQQRHELPFNTDGFVVKINDRRQYDELGIVGKAPRAAVAFKYPAEEATTIVKDIVISIGRTGAATPVAVFDPVVVAGTTVQHASLHNADEIARKDIRIGDTVVIFKAGDIIPQVGRVLTGLRPKKSKAFNMESELKRQYPELQFDRPEGEAVYRVKGATGPLLLKRALQHFASKGALDIDTLGEKNVVALIDAGLVKDLADIYLLTKEQVSGLDRFAEISARKLVNAIQAAKHPPLPRFVYGLGIRHVGAQTAIDLANYFGTLQKLENATLDELMRVDGVGDTVAEAITAWFADPDNQSLLEKFASLGVVPHFTRPPSGPLKGKSFVVTGTLKTMGRDIAAEKIRNLGGAFHSAMTKDTTYLVVGANVGAAKLAKAEKLGTKQIDEQAFLEMIEEGK